MPTKLVSYATARSWIDETALKGGPNLLLGNGFSVAYDRGIFSYDALLSYARSSGYTVDLADKLFDQLSTYDFELVIRHLLAAAEALKVLNGTKFAREIEDLLLAANSLKEGLAQTLAALHPERPNSIRDDAYKRVARFVGTFHRIYTANYDLLLYWTVMQDRDTDEPGFDTSDDGFRNPAYEADHVVWERLNPHSQTIYYLHGALHLYRDAESAELKKLTWVRTGEALIDQIREQLTGNNYPLIVTEGTATEKLAKIQSNDYLARGLRSLASLGGSMLAYGLSFSKNDSHICEAIVKSKIKRLAVSLYGPSSSDENQTTIRRVNRLVSDRKSANARTPLEVVFFDAASVDLWE